MAWWTIIIRASTGTVAAASDAPEVDRGGVDGIGRGRAGWGMKGFTSLPRSLGLFFYFGGLQQEIVFLVRKTLRNHLFLRRCFFLCFILFSGCLLIKYIHINEPGRKSQIIQQTTLITIQVWESCYFCSLATESFMFLWVRRTFAMSSQRNIYLTGIT